MAFGGFVVEAMIRYASNGVSVMERDAAAMRANEVQMARLTGQITGQEAAWHRAYLAQEKTYASQRRLVTSISTGVAVIGAASIGYVADQAAKLQQILISIKNETGASAANIAGAYNTIFAIGNNSGMSPLAAGEIMRTVTRMNAGLRMNGQAMTMDQMRSVAPMVADFASMIHFNRPDVDVNDAAMTGLQMAHLFRAYNPAKLGRLFDLNYRLSGMMGESPDQALRQMSYYEPLFKGLGVSDDTSVALMALLDRAGFRNKVGTNVRAELLEALGPLQLTRQAQAGKLGMLTKMGIFKNGKFAWNNPDGSTNYLGMLGQLANWGVAQHAKGLSDADVAQIIYGTFGRQGGTIAALMADPQMKDILQGIRDYLHDPSVSLAAGKKNRDSSVIFQFQRAMGNLSAVLIELGYPWMQDLTKFFKGLADNLHGFQQWLHSHRDAEKAIGAVFAGITGFAATVATVGAVSQALKFLGIIDQLPNALSLTLLPMRTFLAGIISFATSGTWGTAAAALGTRGAFMVALSGFATSVAAIAARVSLAAAPLLLTDGGVSHDDARKALISQFGYKYWLYLKGRHPGENPYSPDRSAGDLGPEEWAAQQAQIHIHGPVHVHANDPNKFHKELKKMARHVKAKAGSIRTSATVTYGPHARMLHAR